MQSQITNKPFLLRLMKMKDHHRKVNMMTLHRWKSFLDMLPLWLLSPTMRMFWTTSLVLSTNVSSLQLVPAEKLLQATNVQIHHFNPQSKAERGLQVMVDRSPGEPLLRIPLNETITVQNSFLPHLAGQHTSSPDWTEEQKLTMIILDLKSKKHPYISTVFPQDQQYSIWTLPKEAWETEPFTRLPRCYRQTFQITRDHVHQFIETMIKNNNNNDEQTKYDQDRNDDYYSVDDWQWAFSMVRSRSIAVPEMDSSSEEEDDHKRIPPLALIPGIDLCNHQFGAGTYLQLINNEYWSLLSSQPYSAGDQIFLSYGDEKDNLKLFLTYGFVVEDNPNALAFWTWQDLLDVAHSIRPGTFTERICHSLMNHPQLQIYVIPSENKATFSYDLKEKNPRESLQNGLAMLSNLATQLGFPGDTTLPQEALDGLIQKRIDDLRSCLDDFRRPECLSEDWDPFMTSMRLILQDELKVLATL